MNEEQFREKVLRRLGRIEGRLDRVVVVDPRRLRRIDRRILTESLGLTPTESEVAALLAEGLSVKAIAKARGSSEHTVRVHVKNSLRKLRVSRQMDLVQIVQMSVGVFPPGRSDGCGRTSRCATKARRERATLPP